jgi:hypothetical protein
LYLSPVPPLGSAGLRPGGSSPRRRNGDGAAHDKCGPGGADAQPAPLSDEVLMQLFLLSSYRGQTVAERAGEGQRRTAARAAGLVVPPPHVPAAALGPGGAGVRGFAQALSNEQAVQLLRHGSGPAGGAPAAAAGAAVDAAPAPFLLASLWGGAFDRLFSHVVLNLPRVVAEASLACASLPPTPVDADSRRGSPAPLPLPLSLAVGHPLLTSLQDMLTDVDVLTLVREAVAAKVAQRVAAMSAPSEPSAAQ